jgi:hypothetical protein
LRSGRSPRRFTRFISTSRLGLEPDGDAALADAGAGVGVHVGAAAGRQHLRRRVVEDAGDDAHFAGAEIGLAVLVEDLGDRQVRRLLDLGVGVDEGQGETVGEPAADGGLARAHQPDEHDRPRADGRP